VPNQRQLKKHQQQRSMSPALIQALNHPVRRQILRSLHEEANQSSTGLMGSVATGLSNLSYHVKVLHELGVIRRTGARQVRGARERFYASVVVDNELSLSILSATTKDDKVICKQK
jgi:DNA-binding transcriptional ArsR family regulator